MATPLTHFDVFELPRRFDLDMSALEARYRERSLQVHPDRAPAGDTKARLQALEKTTALNGAFKVLKDPVKRAFYLLKLLGVDLDREDAGAQKDMPLEFLEEVMTLREALDASAAKRDFDQVRALGDRVTAQRDEALDRAVAALRTLESTAGDRVALSTAAHQLGRVRYFARFLEEVDRLEEEAL